MWKSVCDTVWAEVELSKKKKFIVRSVQFDCNIFFDIICITTLWKKTLNFNPSRALPEDLIFPNYQCREIIFLQAVEISANWFSSIKMQLNNLILLRQRQGGKPRRVGEKWIERSLSEIINCTWNHCWNVFLQYFLYFMFCLTTIER